MPAPPPHNRAVAQLLQQARRATESLIAPLSDDDVHQQHVDHLSCLV